MSRTDDARAAVLETVGEMLARAEKIGVGATHVADAVVVHNRLDALIAAVQEETLRDFMALELQVGTTGATLKHLEQEIAKAERALGGNESVNGL